MGKTTIFKSNFFGFNTDVAERNKLMLYSSLIKMIK